MNGAVAAAGGDMAKAALAAGLVDKHRRPPRSSRRGSAQLGGEGGHAASALHADQARRPTSPTWSTQNPRGPIGVVTIAGMIVDGKAGPGTAGGDTIARQIEDGIAQQGHQGAGRARRQPRRVGARLRAHPPGAARGQGQEDSGRGVDGQRRRVGRLLGLDARPTSSMPSRPPSPARSACSASCRASRERCRSSASARTA